MRKFHTNRFSTTLRATLLLIFLSTASALNAQPTPTQKAEQFAAAIQQQSTEAMKYLADKIHNHYLVGLGEDHWIKDHPQFLCEALSTLSRDTTVNIDVLAVEFGNRVDQKLADSLIASPTYRPDLAVQILRNDNKLPTRRDIYEYILKNHPILHESIHALIRQESIHALIRQETSKNDN